MKKAFIEIPFPVEKEIVYQIGLTIKEIFFPFYVGQSTRNIGRLGDYISAKFSASTDFKVGEAIKYLSKNNYMVTIRYMPTQTRLADEKQLIEDLRKKGKLLNDIKGYKYKASNEEEERMKIYDFMDSFISKCLTQL